MKITDKTKFINNGKWLKVQFKITLEKNEKNVKQMLEIFKSFQKSDDYKAPSLSIKEEDDNIIIDYGSFMKQFEIKHDKCLKDFVNRIKNINRKIEVKSSFSFDTENYEFEKLSNILMERKEIPEPKIEWFKENITDNLLLLDVLFNGDNSYYLQREKDENYFSVKRYSSLRQNINETSVLKEDESAQIKKEDIRKVYKNIVEKLNIKGYPLRLFNDTFMFMLVETELELFNKIYEGNALSKKARIFYEISKNNLHKEGVKFFKKILKRDKSLSNPLLREKEPELHIYEITGQAMKSDGYSCWESDIYHTFMSHTKLDEDELISLYSNNFNYEVREFFNLEATYTGKRKGSDKYSLVKVKDNGEYIPIPAEQRFKDVV